MKKIAIINCKPEIVSRDGANITLRLPGGAEERLALEEAIRVAHFSPAEHSSAYAKEHGIDLSTPVG